jgi:hypothetical protein
MPAPTSQTGFIVDISDLLRSGVQLNKFDRGIPFWKDVDGLQFTESGAKRRPGRTEIADFAGSVIRGITSVKEYDTKVAYAGDLTKLYSYRLDTDTIDTVGTGYVLTESSGATSWDTGTTTWDGETTVWDEGSNEADQWNFTTFGTFVLAADGVGKIKIKKSNVNFNDLFNDEVSLAAINAAGTGYVLGDTVTFTGGAGTGLTATVTEVLGGAVTAIEVTNFGSGYADADTLTQNTTSGSGTGLTLTLTVPDAAFTRVQGLARLGPHILAFNYDKGSIESPFDFAWCSEDDPDTWVAASANSAGSLTIREADTAIKCAAPLGDGIALYTENQMFLVRYSGAPFYFGYRPVMATGVGAVSVNSVVSVDRRNYGLSKRGFFVTDGVQVEIIGREEGINSYLAENIASSEYSLVTAYHNKSNDEVVWLVPISSTAINKEIYYNYTYGTFGMRSVTLSAARSSGVFDNDLTGCVSGKLYSEGLGVSAQTTTATTRAHDLDDADRIKELTSIRIGKRGTGSPTLQIGWANTIDAAPIYTDTLMVTEDYKEFFLRTAGRYLFINVSSDSPSDSWELSHMVVKGRVSGER